MTTQLKFFRKTFFQNIQMTTQLNFILKTFRKKLREIISVSPRSIFEGHLVFNLKKNQYFMIIFEGYLKLYSYEKGGSYTNEK